MGLATLNHLLSALQNLAKEQIVNLRHQRNELCPVSSLPVEIVVAVFEEYMAMDYGECAPNLGEGDDRLARMSILSLVSRKWNGALRNTPQFWSQIDTFNPPSFIHKALERSQTCPLDIRGDLASNPENGPQHEALLTVFNHVSRWSTAVFDGNSAADFELLTYPPAPRLKTLHLRCHPALSTPLDLLDGKAPMLEHLTLSGVSMRWTSPMLSGLRSFKLCNVQGPTPSQLLEILRACPSLHTLHLEGFQFPTPSEATLGHQPMELLKLESLCVMRSNGELLQLILGHVRCPSASDIRISLPQVLQPETLQKIIHFILVFLRPIAGGGVDDLQIWAFGKRYGFCREIAQTMFHLQIAYASNLAAITSIMEELRRVLSVPSLRIKILSYTNPIAWLELGKFPTARNCQVQDAPKFLSFLETPFERDGTLCWNFLHLKMLRIGQGCCTSGEEVLKMVQSRKGRLIPETATPKQLPQQLESLVIAKECPMDRFTIIKLKTILPTTEVLWEGN